MKGHKAYKRGGKVSEGVNLAAKEKSPKEVYEGKGSNVVKEAEKRKSGGRTCRKDGGKVDGEASRPRLDRPGRKKGGRVGADSAPLSSAARVSSPAGRQLASE